LCKKEEEIVMVILGKIIDEMGYRISATGNNGASSYISSLNTPCCICDFQSTWDFFSWELIKREREKMYCKKKNKRLK